MLARAPLGIAVCGDLNAACDKQVSYLIQDCSAAIENLLLAADALGLGACWLGVHPRDDRIAHLRTTLALPEEILPLSVIAIGWPAETPGPRSRFDQAKVRTDSWA
jgi:nitroreductase